MVAPLLLVVLSACTDPYNHETDPNKLNHAATLVAKEGRVDKKKLERMLVLEQQAMQNSKGRQVPGELVSATAVYPVCGNEPFFIAETTDVTYAGPGKELGLLLEENIESIKKAIESCR
jgi:hypothetical protein